MGGDIPPKDLGGLINRAFSVYSSAFASFAIIALVGQVPTLVSLFLPPLLSVLAILIGLPLSILVTGATIHAVVQQHLDTRVDVALTFEAAWSRILSLVAATILAGVALVGCVILMLILVGIPLFVYVLVVVAFMGEAVIIERKSALAALQRSRQLVQGSWWRVFGIGIVLLLMLIGATIAGGVVDAIVSKISETISSVLFTIYLGLVFQAFAIGRTLLYLDLRARKESYDLSALARDVGRGE